MIAGVNRQPRFPIAHQSPWWDGFSCGCEDEPHSTAVEEADYFDFAFPATPEERVERRRRSRLLAERSRA